MPSKSPATLHSADRLEDGAPDLAELRDQVALLRDSAQSRWQEIAALTRMVQTLEAEKIENRSVYDRERRMLEGEIAELRRMLKKASGKEAPVVEVDHHPLPPMHDDSQWEQMYHEIVNSSSWKITRPMRVAKRGLARLMGRKIP